MTIVHPPLFIADQLALDFLNTVVQLDGERRDLLQSDADVRRWLELAELLEADEALPTYPPQSLRRVARELRELLRELVARRKGGKRLDVSALNTFLAAGKQRPELVLERGGALRLMQRFEKATPEQLLMPIALSGAELLASGNFDLVRACESAECVLQFYDRTKSHRRRWCSMATCGNRHKVAAFRARDARQN
jgi:predicted RNA-binding Zn ribbon-like protein